MCKSQVGSISDQHWHSEKPITIVGVVDSTGNECDVLLEKEPTFEPEISFEFLPDIINFIMS